MRAFARSLATAGVATLCVPILAAPALAETVTETAAVGAYYLSTNAGVVGEGTPLGGQKTPDNAKNFDGVAQDDLGVAVNPPRRLDKFSALQWGLVDLLPGSTVTKATVTVPYSVKPESNQFGNTRDAALVIACVAGPEGFGDADGEPFQDAPSVPCDQGSAPANPVEGGNALEFDITAIAQLWTEMNTGLVLYPSEAGFAKSFQSVFADKSQARLAVAFTSPAGEQVFIDDPELAATAPSTADTGAVSGGFDSGSGTAGFDAGAAPVDSGSSSLGSSSLDTPPVAAPAAAPPPPPAPAVAGSQGTQRQALARPATGSSAMALDGLTWAALIGGAALLAIVSLALGAPAAARSAVRSPARPGGVATALARRAARVA